MEDKPVNDASWWNRPAGGREVLTIALPMVVTTLSWTAMNFIDSSILKRHVSGTAMAAAYTSGIIWFAAMSFLFGLCSYVSTFVAQYHGDGQPRKIGSVIWQGVWLSLSFFLIMPFAQMAAPRLFELFDHPPDLAAMEAEFFRILCYGGVGMLAAQSLETFYSGRGRTRIVMYVDAGAVLLNLVLALLLVANWFGIKSWGVAGAAWATVCAQWCRAITYAALALLPANRRDYHTHKLGVDIDAIRRLIRFGGPSGVQMMLDVSGFAVFLLIVAELGAIEAEATSLAFRISQVAFMPVWGFGIATAILVGQKLGEDRPDLAQRAAMTTLTMSLGYMGFASLLFVLLPRLFLQSFFAHGPEASALDAASESLTIHLMRFVAAYNVLDAAVIILVSVLRGAGDTRFVMAVSVCMASVLMAGTAVGVKLWHANIYGAWTFITAWVWALAVIYVFRYRQGKWRSMRVIDETAATSGFAQASVAAEPI